MINLLYLLMPIAYICICLFASCITLGWYLKKEKYDILESKLKCNCVESKGCINFWYYNFICKQSLFSGIISRYYIHENGNQIQILLWSKADKMITKKFKELKRSNDGHCAAFPINVLDK